MHEVRLKRSVEGFLSEQTLKLRRQLFRKITSLAENPIPPGSKKLDDNIYRIRSGSYRIVYQVKQSKLLVLVVKVGHRQGIEVERGLSLPGSERQKSGWRESNPHGQLGRLGLYH